MNRQSVQSPRSYLRTKLTSQPYYDELILSIPESERESTLAELNSNIVAQKASSLSRKIMANEMIDENFFSDSRVLFLAALKNLKDKKMTISQLATLHLIDAAIHTFYTHPQMQYVSYNGLFTSVQLGSLPISLKRYLYNTTVSQNGMDLSKMPLHMQKPLMQRFFNFSETEWNEFCHEIVQSPHSEQYFYVFAPPKKGCWSSMLIEIQSLLNCMQLLDWVVDGFNEKIMIVPTFSMFQAAIHSKAYTLGRSPVQLMPTYGYIEEMHYAYLKTKGKIAFTLYLPEVEFNKRYSNRGNFRTTIDGHPCEGAYIGALHDVYHAMRELIMSENFSKARLRLAAIARAYRQTPLHVNSPALDNLLVDGELIFSYPASMDTLFNPDIRPKYAQSFGDLFYIYSVKKILSPDLKRIFINDMVVHKDIWCGQFYIGRSDLRPDEQVIYDELSQQNNHLSHKDKDFSDLMNLLNYPELSKARYAIGQLANLTLNIENQNIIFKNHGIKSFMILLNDPDPYIKRYAVNALANMAKYFKGEDYMRESMKPLIALLSFADDFTQYKAITILAYVVENLANHTLIEENNGIAALIFVLVSSAYKRSIRAATYALGHLAKSRAMQDTIRVRFGIAPLVMQLNSEDALTQQFAAYALAHLAENDKNKNVIRNAYGILLLIKLLHTTDDELVIQQVTLALAHLAKNDTNQVVIRENHGLEPLINLLTSQNHFIQKNAARALTNLAMNTENQDLIREQGGIELLWMVVQDSQNIMARRLAICALANLIVNPINQKIICEGRGIVLLIGLLKSDDAISILYATRALGNLELSPQNLNILRNNNAIKPLIDLLQLDITLIQLNTIYLLNSLAKNEQNQVIIRENGGVEQLRKLSCSVDRRIKEIALQTLNDISPKMDCSTFLALGKKQCVTFFNNLWRSTTTGTDDSLYQRTHVRL